MIDLQNGNNHLLVGDSAASGASINYIGGTGNDTLTFGNSLAANSGNLSAILGNGINSVSISNQAGVTIGSGSFGSSITLDGGSGTDQVTVGNQAGGTLTFRLGDGSNSVSVGTASSATFAYVGGSGPDSLSLQSALTGTIDFGSDVYCHVMVMLTIIVRHFFEMQNSLKIRRPIWRRACWTCSSWPLPTTRYPIPTY